MVTKKFLNKTLDANLGENQVVVINDCLDKSVPFDVIATLYEVAEEMNNYNCWHPKDRDRWKCDVNKYASRWAKISLNDAIRLLAAFNIDKNAIKSFKKEFEKLFVTKSIGRYQPKYKYEGYEHDRYIEAYEKETGIKNGGLVTKPIQHSRNWFSEEMQ